MIPNVLVYLGGVLVFAAGARLLTAHYGGPLGFTDRVLIAVAAVMWPFSLPFLIVLGLAYVATGRFFDG
jgi:hypothetical protein